MMRNERSYKEDYELAERKNDNLRTALSWAASHLTDAEKEELEKRLDVPIEEGGVTVTSHEDDLHDVTDILLKLVQHVEPLTTTGYPTHVNRRNWTARLEYLLEKAREFEPKHPLMRRIGGHPNVFAPIKGKIT